MLRLFHGAGELGPGLLLPGGVFPGRFLEALDRSLLRPLLQQDGLEAQYAAVPTYCDGYAGTIRYFWAPGKLVEAAEDITFMTSLGVHREFIVPIHREMGRRFPYTIVHLHSAQLHTVENLLEVEEIAAIEITPDFGEDLRPRLSILARILERKPLIVHGIMSLDAMKEMIRTLPARGLCLLARCNSPAEGARGARGGCGWLRRPEYSGGPRKR